MVEWRAWWRGSGTRQAGAAMQAWPVEPPNRRKLAVNARNARLPLERGNPQEYQAAPAIGGRVHNHTGPRKMSFRRVSIEGLKRTAGRMLGGLRAGKLMHLEHLECSHQPHIQGRGAKKRTQRAG